MRIAIVVQRYGLDVVGGSELEARLVAEHLQPYMQVEVLTTTARDMMTWENFYPAGDSVVNGIPVKRFPVRTPRHVANFQQLCQQVLTRISPLETQMEWMRQQGPDAPELLSYLQDHRDQYDLFIFMTYLYAPTFYGLQIVPEKSILIPTAHDEPPIYLDIFRSTFGLPQAIIFNAPEEQAFVHQRFHNQHIANTVLGLGQDRPEVPTDVDVTENDFILYMGRVEPSKGCDELFENFLAYKKQTGDPVKLVLTGTILMTVPNHPDIIALGYLANNNRFAWLQRASIYVHSSHYESMSISTLEAWSLKIPVLVNGKAEVLKAHCERSKGGFYFQTQSQFIELLGRLRQDPELRQAMGQRGQAYVDENYEWRTIISRYVQFIKQTYQRVIAAKN